MPNIRNIATRSVLANQQNAQPAAALTRPPRPQTSKSQQSKKTTSVPSTMPFNTTVPMHTETVESDLEALQAKSVERFREWTQEAIDGQQYTSAMFWGDKVVSLTGDPDDIRLLAKACFLGQQYMRAQFLLDNPHFVDNTPGGRLLRARCAIKLDKHPVALEILENIPIQDSENNEPTPVYASVAYLKGKLYSRDSNADKAKRCYYQALHADVRCYEAFQALVDNLMLSSDEEQQLIRSLPFEAHCGEDADLVRSMYISQLKKYSNLEQLDEAITRMDNYGLGNNSHVLLSKADSLFTQSRFTECLKLTKRILENDPYNICCRTIHIACLCELGNTRDLFQSSHDLVEYLPDQPVSWFGVGCYYYLVGNYDRARRYFAKSSVMDKDYPPPWLGFGHSLAAMGEHDQALATYTQSARHLIGSHLPDFYVGMQYFQANNPSVASDYFNLSKSICDSDPLLWNEIGVLEFSRANFEEAEKAFVKALQVAEESRAHPSVREVMWSNLAHVYKKQRRFDLCLQQFEKILTLTPNSASAHAGIAFVHHTRRNFDQAVVMYHRSLGLDPTNTVVAELLNEAVEGASHCFNINLPPELRPGAQIDDEMYVPTAWDSTRNNRERRVVGSTTADDGVALSEADDGDHSGAIAIFEDERRNGHDADLLAPEEGKSAEAKRHPYSLRTAVSAHVSRGLVAASPEFGERDSRQILESEGDDVDMDVV